MFAEFLKEMTPSSPKPAHTRAVFKDKSSNSQGDGTGIILENGFGIVVEISLYFEFPSTNNQVKYESFIAKITLGVENIKLRTNSQLVIS